VAQRTANACNRVRVAAGLPHNENETAGSVKMRDSRNGVARNGENTVKGVKCLLSR